MPPASHSAGRARGSPDLSTPHGCSEMPSVERAQEIVGTDGDNQPGPLRVVSDRAQRDA